MPLNVRAKAKAAVAALLDLAAEVDAEEGPPALQSTAKMRAYAEGIEYRFAPDFEDEDEHAADNPQ